MSSLPAHPPAELVDAPAPASEEAPSTEDVFGGDVDRPIAEWLEENVTDHELVIWVVQNTLEPALQVVMILVLASVLVWFLRRAIRHAIDRSKLTGEQGDRGGHRRGESAGGKESAKALRRAQRADALGALAKSVVSVVIWTLALFMILGTFGITLGPLVAGAGILGLALGFGAQGLVSDFISGVFMLIEDQYGVGDIVDAGEAIGIVEGVTLRTTRIRDIEGTLWHVPNGEIRRVGNMSQQFAQSLLDVSVAYQTDVDVAIEVIEGVANAMAEEDGYRDQFLDAPEVWGVQALGPDSVDIRLVIKTEAGKQWGISRELRRRLKAAFVTADIEIPYPQRTVWLRQDDQKSSVGVDVDRRSASVASAVAAARSGDRGAERVLSQDEQAVAADIEEELAEDDDDVGTSASTDRPGED